jgi:hypothetical protein
MAEEEEQGEVELEALSLEHERWRRGSATVAKDGDEKLTSCVR